MPPNSRDERLIIEKINEKFSPENPGKAGDIWYLIPARWWKQWSETETRLPSIDNMGLVDVRALKIFYA